MDKTILITGATGELGPAVVKAFLKAGAKLIITYTSEKKYQQLLAKLDNAPVITGFKTDLTDEEQVKKLFNQIQQQFNQLDALCHLTGGFWMGGDISETSFDDWNHMFDLNLRTTFLCVREAFRFMRQQKGGYIITFSSKQALALSGGMGAYAVSKAGVLAFSEVLAKEGKDYNINVATILPSTIDTEANRRSMPKADPEEAGWIKPEEIANVLLLLIKEEMPLSGTAIKIYGKV